MTHALKFDFSTSGLWKMFFRNLFPSTDARRKIIDSIDDRIVTLTNTRGFIFRNLESFDTPMYEAAARFIPEVQETRMHLAKAITEIDLAIQTLHNRKVKMVKSLHRRELRTARSSGLA